MMCIIDLALLTLDALSDIILFGTGTTLCILLARYLMDNSVSTNLTCF